MTPVERDDQLVRRHLAALDTALAQLRRHTGNPVALLASNLDERWAVERGLLVCAQSCIDIATHMAASAGHTLPDYASAIDALVPMGILEAGFATRFRTVAGFRNLIVHAYLEVDLARLHLLLNERLDDFVQFASCVRAALGSS